MAAAKSVMRRYRVRLRYVVEETYEVAARNPAEARRLVDNRAAGEPSDESIVPGTTESPARWRVELIRVPPKKVRP